MQTTVISLGGSLICPGEIDILFLKNLIELIKKQKSRRFIIITGGGAVCRKYNAAFDELISKQKTSAKDWIGISVTKVNATFVQQLLISSGLKVCESIIHNPKTKIKWKSNNIAIGAGYLPGHSTDYDAVLAAIANGAKAIINLTNIDYVYTKDPRKFKDAKPLKHLTWQEYRKVLNVKKWTAGLHTPFDPLASQLAESNDLDVLIVNGTNLSSLKTIFSDKIKGTIISNK